MPLKLSMDFCYSYYLYSISHLPLFILSLFSTIARKIDNSRHLQMYYLSINNRTIPLWETF